jgi:hypothetical protein
MEVECLHFFESKYGRIFELTDVRYKATNVTFTIKNVDSSHCFTLIIFNLSIFIDSVTKCTLSGEETVKTVLEFALFKNIPTIELLDSSEIEYILSTGETKSISLQELSMLKKGYTWYESFGFKNEFNEYRDFWLHCIHEPFHTTYSYLDKFPDVKPLIQDHKSYLKYHNILKKYELIKDDSVSQMFTNIQHFLMKNCPKEKGNTCTPEIKDRDFIHISGFIKKSFQLLMVTLFLIHGTSTNWKDVIRRINSEDYNLYSLTFLPNGTMVTVSGEIGTIIGKSPGYYTIQFQDKTNSIQLQHVKPLDKVMLHGLTDTTMNHSIGKIVDVKPGRYVVDLGDTKHSVKYKNVKGLGGKSRKRYRTKLTKV